VLYEGLDPRVGGQNLMGRGKTHEVDESIRHGFPVTGT
jgi:hypothetical protein